MCATARPGSILRRYWTRMSSSFPCLGRFLAFGRRSWSALDADLYKTGAAIVHNGSCPCPSICMVFFVARNTCLGGAPSDSGKPKACRYAIRRQIIRQTHDDSMNLRGHKASHGENCEELGIKVSSLLTSWLRPSSSCSCCSGRPSPPGSPPSPPRDQPSRAPRPPTCTPL